MPDYLLQADGSSRFSLADGSGFILLATLGVEVVPPVERSVFVMADNRGVDVDADDRGIDVL